MDTTNATRLTLIEKVTRRDQHGWSEFVPLYAGLLQSYIRRLGSNYQLNLNEEEVEDVRQEVLVKLWRVLPDFQLDRQGRGRFRTWLWTVTRNVTIDWVRGNRPAQAPGTLDQDVAAATVEPDAELMVDHERQVLARILDQVRTEISPAMWACFDGHFLQKKPSKDVGHELGLTVSVVNTNTSRVVKRIREMAEYYDL